MPDFRHGVETISKTVGTVQIDTVRTGVILIAGTAPIHHVALADRPPVDELALITSDADYARFGPDLEGYTIPAALKAHALLKAGVVMVVNVFDPEVHKTAVAEATLNITAGKITLANDDVVGPVTVKHIVLPAGPDVAGVEGTDYEVDRVSGVITILEDGILDGDATAKVAYSYANPAAVDGDDVIGTTTAGGVRSGLQCAYDAMSQFGFAPKILNAAGYSQLRTVQDAMAAISDKLRAVWDADAPAATTVNDAIAGRTPGEDVDVSSVHHRGRIWMPHMKRNDGRVVPLSPYIAALRAWVDKTLGYWWSVSNKQVPGVVAPELTITASLTDENCDANRLNAAGLGTIFAAFGRGILAWGNRTLAFPGSNGIETFESVLRTRDALEEAIELYAMLRVDQPVNNALIDAVLADVNEFFNLHITRGACMPGSHAYFNPALNPSSALANGKVKWSYVFCPPPPCELASFESTLDTTLLSSIGAG